MPVAPPVLGGCNTPGLEGQSLRPVDGLLEEGQAA
jgi:hypothetical protein